MKRFKPTADEQEHSSLFVRKVCAEYFNRFLMSIMSEGGKAMANYRHELAQDAACQNHTSHMTGLWFLPTRPLRLHTNE